ncbi:DUF448 domain-containing protein [Pseudodesulfovibrio sp. JC047]|uniref:YlxR family protein n=1 Tax=Pseudodesulfovibrio sp. JC047 TaxID=2683199 RepID=UPI0013D22579|nr:DUF448 domain-containing protein [Pseudodesulfovibrio sp. JC047]NDV17846.1 DUF448 domain-containing protein [Pseudodesulfovibrio sp. JC047]
MKNTGHKHDPVRMCAVCRERFSKRELQRYVCPEATSEPSDTGPILDPGHTMPGRGIYVCGQTRCRERFPKVLKGLMKKRKRGN